MAETFKPADSKPETETEEAAMARLGIRRVPVDTFHVGAYRYSNLADAIAQAERIRNAKT